MAISLIKSKILENFMATFFTRLHSTNAISDKKPEGSEYEAEASYSMTIDTSILAN
jgi:hypothetical protein